MRITENVDLNRPVGGLDLESFMETSTDSAIESVEKFRVGDHDQVAEIEVDMVENQNLGDKSSKPYQPETEDISQDDE